MDKIRLHFKNNAIIYLILLTCLIIIGIALFVTHDVEEESKKIVDTSMFQMVTLNETLKLFDEKEPRFLVISVNDCPATRDYANILKIAQAKMGFRVYYLDLDTITSDQLDDYDILVEKLDKEVNSQGKIDKTGKFIGNTPMTIIIKDHKQVHGYIGSMSLTSVETLAKLYGLGESSND